MCFSQNDEKHWGLIFDGGSSTFYLALKNKPLISKKGNIAEISHELSVLRASETAALAMAPEQTLKYRRAFSGWQNRNPSTKLGRPPPDGRPGYNAELILMDLAKLRRSAKYKSYLSETKLSSLIKMYQYLSSDGTPDMGDVLNIIAADRYTYLLSVLL